MTRRWLLAIGLTLLANISAAQERIAIRSGEHSAFARLVFPAGPDVTWTVRREGTARPAIWFENLEGRFDLAEVFDLIPRDRIAALRAGAGVLEFELACDCTLKTVYIPSGHIVIDVIDPGDATSDPDDPVLAGGTPAIRLPLRLAPLSIRPSSIVPIDPPPSPPGPRRTSATTPQAVLHHLRPIGVQREATDPDGANVGPACPDEARIATLLRRDPVAVLNGIDRNLTGFFDATDRLDRAGVHRLVETYVTLGWQLEAAHVLGLLDDADPGLERIVGVLTGAPDPGSGPACGPASALLALLADAPVDWESIDGTALARFIGDLPDSRWAVDGSALLARFERDGREDLIVARPAPVSVTADDEGPSAAAGTDGAAAVAALTMLRAAAENPDAIDSLAIANALALRRSIEPGARVAFDAALVEALIAERHLYNAAELARSGEVGPELVLGVGLKTLPEGDAIELAARLRNVVTPGSPAANDAADLLDRHGLPGLARGFRKEGTARSTLPQATATADAADTPGDRWLRRDLASLANGGDGDAIDPRARLARMIVARNRATAETGVPPEVSDPDFRRAIQLRDEANALGAALADLLATRDETGR